MQSFSTVLIAVQFLFLVHTFIKGFSKSLFTNVHFLLCILFQEWGGGTSGFILHPNLWFNVGKFYWFFNYQIEGVRVLLKPEVMQFMLCLRSAATKPCDTTHTLVRKDHLSTQIAS